MYNISYRVSRGLSFAIYETYLEIYKPFRFPQISIGWLNGHLVSRLVSLSCYRWTKCGKVIVEGYLVANPIK